VLPIGARIVTKTFSMGDAWPADAEAYGADEKALFRLYRVTAARKADAELQSDSELQRRFGLHWLQPPNYLGRGPSSAAGAGSRPSAAAPSTREPDRPRSIAASSASTALPSLGAAPAAQKPPAATASAVAAGLREPAAELRRRAAGRGRRAGDLPSTLPRPVLGWSLVIGAVLVWVTVVYMTLVSKALPATGNVVLDWMREDMYFCHLLPMLIPSLILFRYWGWFSMELFKSA